MQAQQFLRFVIKCTLAVCLALFYNPTCAQTCDWLETGGGLGTDEAISVTTDSNNDVIVLGSYRDSFSIRNYFFPKPTRAFTFWSFIIKYDSDGIIKWGHYIPFTNTGLYPGTITPTSVATDANNNIYITGIYNGDIDFGNGVTLSASTLTLKTFLAKYNANGIAQWAVESNAFINGSITHKVVVDKSNNIYFGFHFNNTVGFQGTSQTISSGSANPDIGIAKYTATGSFIDAKNFGGTNTQDWFIDLGIDGNDNIYILGNSLGTFNFGTNTLADTGEIILKINSSLNPIKGKKTMLNAGANLSSNGIAVQANGKFAVANNFYDSVNFGNNTWLKSNFSYTTTNAFASTMSLVFYDSLLQPIWARKSAPVAQTDTPYILPAGGISIKNNNLYFGGMMYNANVKLDPSIMPYPNDGKVKFFVAKADTLGNFLWAFVTNDSGGSSSMLKCVVDNLGNTYATGYFYDKIAVFNQTANSLGSSDFFLAKITDYNIIRGYVSAGPYCAGDTIDVPYTKLGQYKTGNQFIAQLSDSAGNFDGGERELGRVTDTASGVIKGIIPLFNVPTANKYRIRILGTNPIVQSYYRRDTLRLLIYSKDKANAGPDTAICFNHQIRLGTTGGSRWNWWPPTYMLNPADTANRQPLIKPDSTTEYRIIISDSSGCGEIDTDYVKVIVRQPIKAAIQGDSVVCAGYKQYLVAKVTGGDTAKYWYQWRTVGVTSIQSKNKAWRVGPIATTKYMLVVGDSCGEKIDTAYFTLKIVNNLTATPSADTTICNGETIILSVTGTGCNPAYYKYAWYEKGKTTVISTTTTLTITPTVTTQYNVILRDTTALLVDTATIKVTVNTPLKVTVNADTAICVGESAELRATITGGNAATRKLLWTADSGPWTDTNRVININPNTTTKYKVVLSDGCTPISDSAFITVAVSTPLKVVANTDTTICAGEMAEIRAVATGGNAPTHQLLWTADNGLWTSSNYTEKVKPSITTKYKVVLSDGCTPKSDSAFITVTVRPPLKVTLNPDTTICVGETAELRAVVSGGNVATHSLLWTADGGPWTSANLSEIVNPAATTTYKALLNDNCTLINDSAVITVTVRPPLSVSGVAKDSICSNQVLLLTATPSGGYLPNHQILWTVDGGPWASSQNPASDTPKISTKYIVKLSDNCSPDVFDTLDVVVLPAPMANFSVAPVQGCPPLTVSLTDVSVGNDSLRNGWTVQGVEYGGVGSVGHEFTKPGYYDVALSVSNVLGCADYKIQRGAVTVFDKPVAGFTVKPDIKEVDELVQLYNNSRNATNVIWDMGNGQQLRPKGRGDTTYLYGINDTGDYPLSLIAQNNQGCLDTATQTIRLFDKVFCAIPSGFTPNGDGLNDVFTPVCNGVAFYTLTIYNRWGQVILECENCSWDGTYAGTVLSQDVYMYKLQIQADSYKKKLTYGTVQIVR
jgi:gliding motility-associated-like protein